MPTKFTDKAIAYLKAPKRPISIERTLSYAEAALSTESRPVVVPREDSPIVLPYADGLGTAYLLDQGNAYHYIQYRHLDEDGISEDELHRIGLRNLTQTACNRNVRVQPYHNIFAVLMGGDFEASLILLDELWETHFRRFVSGDYAIAIPNRDILAFCDSTSSEGIAELRQMIDKIHKTGDHPISDRIYVRRNGKWIFCEL